LVDSSVDKWRAISRHLSHSHFSQQPRRWCLILSPFALNGCILPHSNALFVADDSNCHKWYSSHVVRNALFCNGNSSCCASRFTWASTSNSEAQEARDKHNCRSCGGLVCDPCSKSRAPIPSIGITVPVRVCDKCYNDINGTNSSRASVQSFQEVDEEGALCDFPTGTAAGSLDQASWDTERSSPSFKPERQREKRSIVVDDLVSRIRSSSLAGH